MTPFIPTLLALTLSAPLQAAGTASSPVAAQPAPELARSLAELNQSVQQIAALLREFNKRQETDLLMKRADLSDRQLSSNEGMLRAATVQRDMLSDELKEVQSRLSESDQELGAPEGTGARLTDAEIRRLRDDLGRQETILKERVAAAEQKIIELENDLAAQRRAAAAIKERIDAQLGLK